MSHYSVKPLRVVLQPSRQLLLALLGVSLMACLILLCMPLAWWMKASGAIVIAAGAAYSITRDACLALPWSWRAIDINVNGEVVMSGKDGSQVPVSTLPTSFVASYLTVLHLKQNTTAWPRYCVILSDSADSEQWRKLRVWLRWGMPIKDEESPTVIEDS